MWTAILGNVLVAGADRWGSTWGWRLTRFVHALPFLAAAFVMGWAIGYVYDIPPMFSAFAESGGVAFCMAISWFKEWRRGY